MSVDTAYQPYGSIPDFGTPLSPPPDYFQEFHNPGAADDDDVEISAPSSPSTFIRCSSSSPMTTPEIQFNDDFNNGPDRYAHNTTTPADAHSPDRNYLPGSFTTNGASSNKAEPLQNGGNLSHSRLPPSSFSPNDEGRTHFLHSLPASPTTHGREQHQPPLTQGCSIHSYSIHNSQREDDYQSIGSYNKVFKIFSQHAKENAGKIKGNRHSAVTPRKLANSAIFSGSRSRSSSIASTQGGLANAHTESIVEPNASLLKRDMIMGHGQGHELTTFRNLEEGRVSGEVFVNSPTPVTVNNGISSRQSPDLGCNRKVGANMTHESSPTIATHTSSDSEHSEYEIYYKYLSVKKRGFPLWEPGPHLRLPPDYRRKGVSNGDVGILNATTGAFSFLFNIFLPANHDINRWVGVPNGFIPLKQSKAQKNMTKATILERCRKSSSLQVRESDSSNLVFQTTRREGAVLVMPDGGLSEDLQNCKLIEKYVATNAESWWGFVKSEDCGVPTDNEIQVVIGTDKVSSWGMATFENVKQFAFKDDWTASQTRTSKWSGIDGRAGPAEEEIRDYSTQTTEPLRNQCVFVRTLNVSVSATVRDKSAVAVCSNCSKDCMAGPTRSEAQLGRIQSSQAAPSVSHPSKLLNRYLLENCPNAKVVITRDSDWMSIITENDDTLPSAEEICKRVLASHAICEKKGVVTLEKREKVAQITTSDPCPTTTTAPQTTSEDLLPTGSSATLSDNKADESFRLSLTAGIHKPHDKPASSSKYLSRINSKSTPATPGNSHTMNFTSRLRPTSLMTSFSSNLPRMQARKLDVEIPSHSLLMDPHLFSNSYESPRDANTATETSLDWSQGLLLRQTSERPMQPNFIDKSAPLLQAGTSERAPLTRLDQDQGILRPTPTTSPQIDSVATKSLQHLSPLGQAIQSSLRTFHLVDGIVTSGSMEGLVQFLIAGFGSPGHTDYRDAFLTACFELTTPEDLFQILSRRLSEEEHISDEGFGTQYTIFLVIIHWLKSGYFSQNEMIYRIKLLCETFQHSPSLDSIANEACQLIDVKLARFTAPPTPREPVLKSSEIKPQDLAVALSLLEGDQYKALQPADYLLYLSKGQSDGVKKYHSTNEKIRLWVISSILRSDTVLQRSEIMKFFIYTALECQFKMRNLSSTAAISSALQSVPIENLKATTRAARMALDTKTQDKLPGLSAIIHPESNHRAYYNAIKAASTISERDTCIPWLPIHLKELDKVVRQPVTIQVDGQHLVNFKRYTTFMDRVRDILHYSPPDLEDKRYGGQLTYLSNNLRDIDLSGDLEQELLTRSRALSIQESSSKSNRRVNLHNLGFEIS